MARQMSYRTSAVSARKGEWSFHWQIKSLGRGFPFSWSDEENLKEIIMIKRLTTTICLSVFLGFCWAAAAQTGTSNYTGVDIGSPAVPGSFQEASGGVNVVAGGLDIGGTNDQFFFVYQTNGVDFDIKVRLPRLDPSDPYAEAGLMARATLETNSVFAAVLATPSLGGCSFASRATTGARALAAGSFPVNYPYTWLRLQRTNNAFFSGYASLDGQHWILLGSVTLSSLPSPIYVGFAAASHSSTTATVTGFQDWAEVSGAPAASPLVRDTEPLGPCSRRTGFVISELMYHPRTITNESLGRNLTLEFIELYNSQPYFEDLSGYSLTGDVNFTFPAGMRMEAGSFLVLAKVPGDVQLYYGLSNVLGYGVTQYQTNAAGAVTTNIVNSLNNGGGVIRLRNPAQAVLLEVNYSTAPPWPTAADGAGHSLVLARPSYGEGDSRAWAASAQINGSPGGYEVVVPDPARAVVINEFLANSKLPEEDFVELYNHGNEPVDLSGFWLSDTPGTNKYRIQDGTMIGPRGYVYFTETQVGFALSALGEKIFLVNSNRTRVVDAIRFDAQSENVSFGRCPDGSSVWRELASLTRGAPNSGYKQREIVISEIMYAPISGDDNDEYIELYNKGTNPVDLGGWRFLDGISFVIPSNTVIAAGGYLVVARNAAQILSNYANLAPAQVVGDYGGVLRNSGERVALAMPEIQVSLNNQGQPVTNTIYPVVNEVTYGTSERWGIWANGGGSSLELADPRSDNRLAANWADSDETAKGQWESFTLTGSTGRTLGSPTNDQVQIFLLDVGECQVDNVALTNRATGNFIDVLFGLGSFETGMASWTCQGSHDQSYLDLPGYQSGRCLHVVANSRGDNGANRIRSASFPQITNSVTFSAKARWVRGHPEVLFRLHGGGLEMSCRLPVPRNLGTPGLPNSQAVANAGPAISEIAHQPVLPADGQPVVVTARAADPDGLSSVMLRYRIDPDPSFASVAMTDDGTGGDAVAGDGIYSATLPGQPAGALVAFYIQATDGATPAVTSLYPANALIRTSGNDAPSHELIVRFGEALMPGAFPTYHLWLTSGTSNRWYYRDRLSNGELDGTFVYNDCRVIYNMKPLYAGSPWHSGQMTSGPSGINRVDYAPVYPDDEPFFGSTSTAWANPGNPSGSTFSDQSLLSEQTSYLIFKAIGLHYNYRRFMHLFVNGNQRSTYDGGPTMLIEDAQQPNADAVKEWYSSDPNGQLFKVEDWFEFGDDGYSFVNDDARLERFTNVINGVNQLNPATYRFKFRRRAINNWDSASDYTNFFALVNAVSPPANPSSATITNVAQVEYFANIEQWMRIFACQHTVGNWDAYGYNRGKNDFFYKPVNGRFEQMTWDIDFTMGLGGDGAATDLFGTTDPRLAAMWNTPQLLRYYWQAYEDIVNGPLNNSHIDPILNGRTTAFDANGIYYNTSQVDTIKNYVRDRRSYLTNRLASYVANFSVTQPVATNFTSNVVYYSGSAPLGARRITVNDTQYPISWTGVTSWTMAVPIGAGSTQLVFTAYDRLGNVTNAPVTRTAVYTGPPPPSLDRVVINEIMFDPLVPGAEYVELFNTSSNYTFDLSGWIFNGLGYTFPDGTLLAPRRYLVLAKDRTAFLLAYGPFVTVFDNFPGNLQADGETLTLIQPGATPAQDVVVDQVKYGAGPPWPAEASGTGSSLQLIDSAQDNSRPGNWQARYVPAVYTPEQVIPPTTNSGWRMVSITGSMGAYRQLYLYLNTAGDVYVDDLALVKGTTAAVGSNYIKNGDFELALTNGFTAATNCTNSAVSADRAHGGSSALHLVFDSPGSSGPTKSLYQTLPAPAVLTIGTVCTLSFWYWVTPNAQTLTAQVQGNATLSVTTNVTPLVTPGSTIPPILVSGATNYATPGAANTVVTNLPLVPAALAERDSAAEPLRSDQQRGPARALDRALQCGHQLCAARRAVSVGQLHQPDQLGVPEWGGDQPGRVQGDLRRWAGGALDYQRAAHRFCPGG